MKNVMLTRQPCVWLIVALLLCLVGAGCQNATFWGGTADNADKLLMTRFGYEYKIPDANSTYGAIEPYFQMDWLTRDPEWGPQPDQIGGGLIYHINEVVLIEDPDPDNPLELLLHSMRARPYVGIGVGLPTRGEQREADLNYRAGTMFAPDEKFILSLFVEYISGEGAVTSEDNSGILIGGRYKF